MIVQHLLAFREADFFLRTTTSHPPVYGSIPHWLSDDLFFRKVSVLEYRAFSLRESHTTGLAFEHLVAFGIEPFFDDVASVSLSVIQTIRVQTYLVF